MASVLCDRVGRAPVRNELLDVECQRNPSGIAAILLSPVARSATSEIEGLPALAIAPLAPSSILAFRTLAIFDIFFVGIFVFVPISQSPLAPHYRGGTRSGLRSSMMGGGSPGSGLLRLCL